MILGFLEKVDRPAIPLCWYLHLNPASVYLLLCRWNARCFFLERIRSIILGTSLKARRLFSHRLVQRPWVILDTNVIVAGLRSRRRASFKILSLLGRDFSQISVSLPLVLEYESASKRMSRSLGLSHSDIDDVIDYICSVAEHREIYYLWRPFLRDPMDDMVLEVAVESGSEFTVTHNVRHFAGIEQFGVKAINPSQFLQEIGELSWAQSVFACQSPFINEWRSWRKKKAFQSISSSTVRSQKSSLLLWL